MSIQVYECSVDGDFDLRQKISDPIQNTQTCPTCGCESKHVFRLPAPVQIERTWNDRANEEQRTEYTKTAASLEDHRNAQRNLGKDIPNASREDIVKMTESIKNGDRSNQGVI